MPTVIQLRDTLRRYGLPVSGKKADLIKRITEARATEFSKRARRTVLKGRFPAFQHGSSKAEQLSEVRRLREEADAALRASAYEKKSQKTHTLRVEVQRRLQRRCLAQTIIREAPKLLGVVGEYETEITGRRTFIWKFFRRLANPLSIG